MKSLLSLLSLLLTAVSASAMAPSVTNVVSATSLFDNNVGGSYHRNYALGTTTGSKVSKDVSATAYLAGSDVFTQASSTVGGDAGFLSPGNGKSVANLGYRFKNVRGVADVAFTVGSHDTLRVAAFREVGSGFAVAAVASTSQVDVQYGLSVRYKIDAHYSVDLNYTRIVSDSLGKSNDLAAGLRYGF